MRTILVFLAVAWIACSVYPPGESPTEGTTPTGEAQESNESIEVGLFSSEVIPIFEPVDDITSDRCTQTEMNQCTKCLEDCQKNLSICKTISGVNDELLLECAKESIACRERCRKSIDVLCDCRKL